MKKLLELRGLQKHYPVRGGILRHQVASVKALDGIDLEIYRGECLGLVGESGCGKTTTGKSIIRLHRPTGGKILYHRGNGHEPVDIAGMSRGRSNGRASGGGCRWCFRIRRPRSIHGCW